MARKTGNETTETLAATASGDGTADFIVTEDAPAYVAGRPVAVGDTIRLTPEQALFEKMAGHVVGVELPSKAV